MNNKSNKQPSTNRSHDKVFEQLSDLRKDQSLLLLQELHILTRDGKINQDSRRKLKQVNHLYQFILPILQKIQPHKNELTLVDHGAGKSYLGFILYDLFFKDLENGHITGIETRQELVEKSTNLASKLGFKRMSFIPVSVEESITSPLIPEKVDVVTALHACDTATDDAIDFALKKQAQSIVLVPCCQAEIASCLRKHKNTALSTTFLSELWRHPLHSREFGSHLTNVLRCLRLESHGYQVTVTELIGWEHSMKNELIIANYTGQKKNSARARLKELLSSCQLDDLQERFN